MGKFAGKKPGKKNPKGFKKKSVKTIYGVRAGKKGEAAAYITRAQALAKLQLSLANFRKLCILKGVYPRDPKKTPQGKDKTYYHKKDISFLAHEPLLHKFYELNTFMKKFKRLIGRGELDLAKDRATRKPQFNLQHLVRERYPNFEDAIRDLDDAVSMLALFQSLPADKTREIPVESITEATRLYQEFQLYVIRTQSLRKVFASVKGYYFQAEIQGTTVTWLAPHQFSQELPQEVDFRVLLTFLDFYRCLLKFVNFRLYAEHGMAYPPPRAMTKDEDGAEVASLEIEMKQASMARQARADEEEKADKEITAAAAADFGADGQEAAEIQRRAAEETRMKSTFRGLNLFINREVVLRPVYFTLLCGGVGQVGWERGATGSRTFGRGSAFGAEGESITHQVVDRPVDQIEKREGRELVQPQWVFDSFNTGCVLPVSLYAPGRAPPPHLSPFVNDEAEGYVPRQRELLDKLANEAGISTGTTAAEESKANAGTKSAADAEVNTFDKFNEELALEQSGVWHAEREERKAEDSKLRTKDMLAAELAGKSEASAESAVAEPKAKPSEEEEETLRRKSLMSKKHRRLLHKIDRSKAIKEEGNERLRTKRKQNDKNAK